MATQYQQGVKDVDGGRSKLSDYSTNSTEDMMAVHQLRSILQASGAFAEEEHLSEEPTVIRGATESDLQDHISARGSCGSGPEKIRDALKDFETICIDEERKAEAQSVADAGMGVEMESRTNGDRAASFGLQERFQAAGTLSRPAKVQDTLQSFDVVYVDPECRLDVRPLAKADVMRSKEGSTNNEQAALHVLQDRFLPAAESMGPKMATKAAPRQGGQRLPMQELSMKTLLSPRFEGAFPLYESADKVDSGRISDKENVEPEKSRFGTAPVRGSKRRGNTGAAFARKQVRPPGLSQVEWLRLVSRF